MVFLPPDQSTHNPYVNTTSSHPFTQTEDKVLHSTTTHDHLPYPTPAGDGVLCGAGVAQFPEQEYSYHYTPQSMILVQVNAGETFTIQAEDGTQCIQGPAQVPMVSANGAIPPIHVPHGYMSQVIEENGLKRVVVLPENISHTHFPGSQAAAPQPHIVLPQQSHGMLSQFTLHSGPYMPPMNMMSLNQQAAYAQHGEQMQVFHPLFVPENPMAPSDGSPSHTHLQQHPHFPMYPVHAPDMDSRASKTKERLQKKLQHRQQQQPEFNKNASPTSMSSMSMSSISPSSASSFGPSPNSSPESSPGYPNGCNSNRIQVQSYFPQQQQHQHVLGNLPHFQCHSLQYPSPTHSPSIQSLQQNNSGCSNRKSKSQNLSVRSTNSDDMSSGSSSSSSGSPRHGPQRVISTHPTVVDHQPRQLQESITQQEVPHKEPFPNLDSKIKLREFLTAISKPEVYDILPRSTQIRWSMQYLLPEDAEFLTKQGQEKPKILFVVSFSDKGKDPNRFKIIHCGDNQNCKLIDLKPGVEYHTRVQAELNSVKGSPSEITSFRTQSCTPDTPGAPKLHNKTKNSLNLKWTAPHDNGEKIINYHLEWDEGKKGSGFRHLYADTHKQYKVNKLMPSASYTFRLCSTNKMGSSPWSPEVTYSTSGTAPSAPDPPRLAKATIRSLALAWSRQHGGGGDAYCKFTLEMDDPSQGYGFRAVYDGPELRTILKNLTRHSVYKFRLCSYNNEGKSGYSNIAAFQTLPDRPSPPGKVLLKGKAHTTSFRVAWDPPKDSGGSDIAKYVLECSHERGQQMSVIYSGPEREWLVEGTKPGLQHRLRVYCITDGGSGLPSEVTVIITPPVTPGPCAPPRLASKTKSNVICLKWDPPNYNGGSSIILYEVASQLTVSVDDDISVPYQGPNLEHPFTGLKPGTSYKFFVRAANKIGKGPWSDSVEISTAPGPPEKSAVPTVTTVTSSYVVLEWEQPHDNGTEILSYNLEWGSAQSSMALHQIGSSLNHHLYHLVPDTTYFFRIQAHNSAGSGPFSDVGTVTTEASCPERVPRMWQCVDFYDEVSGESDEENEMPSPATSALIKWEVPVTNGSDILTYVIQVIETKTQTPSRKRTRSSEAESSFLVEVEDSVTCFLLKDLQPSTEYSVRVKALNEVGHGPYSSPILIETQPLPPDPPTLECQCYYNSLKLKWGDADSYSTSTTYLLQIKDKHGRFVTIYNGSSRGYKVIRLSERNDYQFRINARNHAGEGPFSQIFTFTTITAPPPQFKYSPLVAVKNNIAIISWEDVDTGKGEQMSYSVNIEDSEGRKQCDSVPHSPYSHGPLSAGVKYHVQVAPVRHVQSAQRTKVKKPTDIAKIDSEDFLDYSQGEEVLEATESEEIVGQFSSWLTFEAFTSDHSTMSKDSESAAASIDQAQSGGSSLKAVTVEMSDEKKSALLLAMFFIFAVIVAFLVQFLVA